MKRIFLVLDRLDQLLESAGCARDEFEFAGVYGAIRFALEDLVDMLPEGNSYAHEKIAETRWNLRAAVGYEIGSSCSQKQHLLWAIDSLGKLRRGLRNDSPRPVGDANSLSAVYP